MNREDIIRMVREAKQYAEYVTPQGMEWFDIYNKRFAILVASAAQAKEREACAKVADTISDKYGWGHYGNEVDTADEIAKAIRARGEASIRGQT